VAACELAFAEVDADDDNGGLRPVKNQLDASRRGIRRCPAIVLLRCAYDIRSIFEAGVVRAAPARWETRLVVALPSGSDYPQVFEVPPAVFDLLAALDDWINPLELDVAPGLAKLLADLAQHGLVEVC
jgi:hypothetical protein